MAGINGATSGAVRGISRRRFLQGAGVAVAGGVPLANGTFGLSPAAAEVATGLGLSDDPVLHLLRRTTFGPTPELVAKVRSMSIASWIDEQLACDSSRDSDAVWTSLAPNFPTLNMTAQQVHTAYTNSRSVPQRDLQAAAAVRQAYSVWQLREVMVEFWSNHFNICGSTDDFEVWCKGTDDREVTRGHALGKFSELLNASAHSPAMLSYLDNAFSVASNPNENYARELLELHTLGADALYHRGGDLTDPAAIGTDALAAEADVANATKVLTGWSADFNWQPNKAKYGNHLFAYKAYSHHVGPVGVYGWTHANDKADATGEAVGISLLDYLSHHPATARHLATKLCAHFVDDNPTVRLVDEVVAVYLASDTAIGPVLRTILLSPEFAASSGAKWRRPVELFGAMVRAAGLTYNPAAKTPTTINNPLTPEDEGKLGGASQGGQTMIDRLTDLDQTPFGWHTPDGFPYEPEPWTSPGGQLDRWNAAYYIASGLKGFTTPTAQQRAGGVTRPPTAGGLIDALTQTMCGQTLGSSHRQVLLDWLGKADTAVITDAELDAGAKGRQLMALILSSPYLQLR